MFIVYDRYANCNRDFVLVVSGDLGRRRIILELVLVLDCPENLAPALIEVVRLP